MNTRNQLIQIINYPEPDSTFQSLHNDENFDCLNIVISKYYDWNDVTYHLEGYGLEGHYMNINRNEIQRCTNENEFVELIENKFKEEFGRGLDEFNINVFCYNMCLAVGEVEVEFSDSQVQNLYELLVDGEFNKIKENNAKNAYDLLVRIALGISRSARIVCSNDYRKKVLALFEGEVDSIIENGFNDKQKEKLEEFTNELASKLSIVKFKYNGQEAEPNLTSRYVEKVGHDQCGIDFTIRAFGHGFPIVGSVFRGTPK